MAIRTPISLTPSLIELNSTEFMNICEWPFADSYVRRLLRCDIPQRVQFTECRVWIYRDPDGRAVGFGSIDLCDDYRTLTAGAVHPYIPLLAVEPSSQNLGHGGSIVRHLIGEAVILARQATACHPTLFLDVYTNNIGAIRLYEKNGFVAIKGNPLKDTEENDQEYIVMMKRVASEVSIARAPDNKAL